MPIRDRELAAAYQAAYRRGYRSPRRVVPVAARLLRRVDRTYSQRNTPELGECWEWTGARNSAGYGLVKVAGAVRLAHRVALEIALGRPIADGMYANHRCDNPPCIRPRHLYEGTPEQNARDCVERGRHVGFETAPEPLERWLDRWAESA